jgi:hypothetical protein
MSQQQKTTTTGQYNQGSMGVFNQFQPQLGQAIGSQITNPYASMFFNTQLGMGQQQLGMQGATANQAMLQRFQGQGMAANSPFLMGQMGMSQRQGMTGQSNLFGGLLGQAGQMRQAGIGMAGQYRPLQTGGQQTQSVSGLGSWLPQVTAAMLANAKSASMAGGGG